MRVGEFYGDGNDRSPGRAFGTGGASRHRLPELLARGLKEPTTLPAHVYRYVLNFLASRPTPEQVAAFSPTPEMIERLQTLLGRQAGGEITPAEKAELDEYDWRCNRHKGSDLASFDPERGELSPLFNPRTSGLGRALHT